MSDIVVTGGTGFLGRALLSELIREGERPLALVRRTDAIAEIHAQQGDRVRVIPTDLTSSVAIRSSLSAATPKVVFHLAGGRADPGPDDCSENLAANVVPAAALIDALSSVPLDAFVLVSTGEVYGPQPGPFSEELLLHPVTQYAASKVSAEAIVLGAHRSRQLPGIVARLSVVYGPGPWASNRSRSAAGMMLPQLMKAALSGKRFPMSSGAQTRDFLYVEDAVRALLLLSREPRARGQIINVGAGESHAVGDVANRMLEILGRPIALQLGALADRPNEILDYRMDTRRLVKLTNFSPRWALDDGLREMARCG